MIFISAGHYPSRPGAKYKDCNEHEEAVAWVDLLVSEIGARAVRVPVGTLREKCKVINAAACDRDSAVEIHFNSFKIWEDLNRDGLISEDELRACGKGCETLYYPGSGEGLDLAQVCQDALSSIFPPNRGVKEGWYRMNPKNGPDYFLAQTRCPAAILEPDFIHRQHEIQTRREEAIEALAEALRNFDER